MIRKKGTTMAIPRPLSKAQQRREAAARVTKHRRLVRAGLIATSIAIVAVVLVLAISASSGGGTGVTEPDRFSLPRIQGDGQVELADYRGKPVVVNFFASWCTACDAELPDFRDAARRLDGEVSFVFVNSNETGNWRPMVERHDLLGLPLAEDVGGNGGNGLYRSLGGTGGMPITAFYGPDGNVVDVVFGALTGGALQDAIEEAYGDALT